MTDRFPTWDSALQDLGDRALSGKTASTLVSAAENALAETAIETEKWRTAHATQVERNEHAAAELTEVKKQLHEAVHLQPTTKVTDSMIEYSVAAPGPKGWSAAVWRLDQLENVLTWLRLQGATDDTIVLVGDQVKANLPFDSFDTTLPPPIQTPEPETGEVTQAQLSTLKRRLILITGLFLTIASATGTVAIVQAFAS